MLRFEKRVRSLYKLFICCQGEELNALHLKTPVEMMQDVAINMKTFDIKKQKHLNIT